MRTAAATSVGHELQLVSRAGEEHDRAVHKGRVVVKTTIGRDGRITVGPIAPKDFPRVRGKVLAVMRAIGRGNPVVVTECLTEEQKEAMAQRLAQVVLKGLVQ